jgi:hypothetical protein
MHNPKLLQPVAVLKITTKKIEGPAPATTIPIAVCQAGPFG